MKTSDVTETLELALQALGCDQVKVHEYRRANKTKGIAVQNALRLLGSKTVYWNNGSQPGNNIKSGGNGHTYGVLKLPVDFKNGFPNTSKPIPSILRSVPFGFGTAEDGYHVFITTTDKQGEFATINGSVGNGPVQIKDVENDSPSGAFYKNPKGSLGVMSDYSDGIIAIPPISQ